MKNKRLLIIHLTVLMAVILAGCSSEVVSKQPQASEGLLDLSEWRLQEQIVNLDGQWEFYAGQLISPQRIGAQIPSYINVPSSWNKNMLGSGESSGDGHATYRLLFKTETGGRLALKLPRILTAYKLWINQELIASAGIVGTSRTEMTPQYLPQVGLFDAQPGINEIIIQVSNYYHRSGGILESIAIGPEQLVLNMREKGVAYELFLFGSLAIIGAYHVFLYVFRKQNTPPLYFGLFCLFISARTLLVGERFFFHLFPAFNWELAHKLQTLTFYLGVPLIVMFFQAMFPKDFSAKWVKAIQLVGLAFTALVLFTPARIFTIVNPMFQVFALSVIAYLTAIFVRMTLRKEKGIQLIIIGGLALFATSINDIVFLSVWMNDDGPAILRTIFRTGNLSSFGQLIFVFANSLLLAQKFSQALEQQEVATTKLQDINIHLDELVSKRTAALEASREQIEQQKIDLEAANCSLRLLTLKDPLTGLWNRRQYDAIIQKEWHRALRHKRPISMLLLDIDYFKAYNDCYGHSAGDACLARVAQAIQSCFKRASDLVARYGGEEFVVIMPELVKDEAMRMAHFVQDTVAELCIPHECSNVGSWVTVSVGVTSCIPRIDSSPEDLFFTVDKALYEAKEGGRSQVKFRSLY